MISKATRFDVLTRDNFCCQYCGRHAPEVILEIDHIIPVSKHGTDDKSNLITSCLACNRGKHTFLIKPGSKRNSKLYKKLDTADVIKISKPKKVGRPRLNKVLFCMDCGKPINRSSKTGRCHPCANKYKPKGISDNSKDISAFRKNNPCLNMSSIGRKFKVSRERVRQILTRADIRTTSINRKRTFSCIVCGRNIPREGMCAKCRKESKLIEVACTYCGGLKKMNARELIFRVNKQGYNHFFCTRRCQGKWLADNHGFGVHPENITSAHRGSKLLNLLSEGKTIKEISQMWHTTESKLTMLKAKQEAGG